MQHQLTEAVEAAEPICVKQDRAFPDNTIAHAIYEPYRTESGYLAHKDHNGSECIYSTENWAESTFPNPIQQAIHDVRSDITTLLQTEFHMTYIEPEDRSDTVLAVVTEEYAEALWAHISTSQIESEGRTLLAELQAAKVALEECHIRLRAITIRKKRAIKKD